MPFWPSRSLRTVRQRAHAFTARLRVEPAESDIAWLAEAATRGDLDHAAWELRYARRALGVLIAQRDGLDDRIGSTVARAVLDGFLADPAVDPKMVEVAIGQYNARLSAYRDILHARGGAEISLRLGQMVLAFAGGPIGKNHEAVAHAGQLLGGYLAEASVALQEAFGSAKLPEHLLPSAMARGD